MRLFIAINFDDEVKKELVNIQNKLKKHSLRGNFTKYDNLHLTLVFLGEINENIELIKKAMNDIILPPFELCISGTGCFKRNRGDIWWAGIDDNKGLSELQRRLSKNVSDAGFSIENRRFVPHLTLAREVRLQSEFNPAIITDSLSPIRTEVSKISLMHSHRINGILTYTEIYGKTLK